MKSVNEALADMKLRLRNVETTILTLKTEVQESNANQQASLVRLEQNAEAMRQDAEAMRRDAEAMRQDAEAMRRDAETMQHNTEEMRQNAQTMHRDVGRNTALFDQATTKMVDDLQHYQGSVAIVVEFLVKNENQHKTQHEDLVRRVEALERKMAG